MRTVEMLWQSMKTTYYQPEVEHVKFLAMRPVRSAWNGFPDVIIHTTETAVKKHPLYRAAKAGDAYAAQQMAREMVSADQVAALREIIGERKPTLVSAHAYEAEGTNAIPQALADELGERLRLPVDQTVVQTNVVGHTGANGFARLARPALFNGDIEPGRDYLIVDDFVGQGGTLANLRGFIENEGGHVVGATVLTGKPYSAKIAPDPHQLIELENIHGNDLASWWREKFGYSLDRLT